MRQDPRASGFGASTVACISAARCFALTFFSPSISKSRSVQCPPPLLPRLSVQLAHDAAAFSWRLPLILGLVTLRLSLVTGSAVDAAAKKDRVSKRGEPRPVNFSPS